jgi:hypothetical protein
VVTNSVDIQKEEAVSKVIEPWSFEPVRATQNNKDELMAINGGGKNSTTSTDTETPLHTNFKGAVVNDRAQIERKSTHGWQVVGCFWRRCGLDLLFCFSGARAICVAFVVFWRQKYD